MSFLARVRHVFWKDVRQFRWLLLAFALLTVLATAASLTYPTSTGLLHADPARITLAYASSGWSVLLISMVVVGVLVQADNPTRDDAYWATRPLGPGAVLLAKVLLVVLFGLLVPVVGQALALTGRGVPLADLPPFLARSVLIHAGVLTVVALLAALTPDLRSFVVAVLLGVAGWAVLENLPGLILSDLGLPVPRPVQQGTIVQIRSVLWLGFGSVLVVGVYRSRRRKGALVALVAAALAASVIMHALSRRGAAAGGSGTAEPRPALIARDLRVAGATTDPVVGADMVFVHLRLQNTDSAYQYVLTNAKLTLTPLGQGSAVSSGLSSAVRLNGRAPNVLPNGFRRVDRGPAIGPTGTAVAPFPASVVEAVKVRGGRFELAGSVHVIRWDPVAILPLRPGEAYGEGVGRIELPTVRFGPPRLVLEVAQLTTVDMPRPQGLPPTVDWVDRFALVNRARAEFTTAWSGSGGGTRAAPFVMEGPRIVMSLRNLDYAVDTSGRAGAVPEWLAGADLMLLEPASLGTYDIRLVIDDFHFTDTPQAAAGTPPGRTGG